MNAHPSIASPGIQRISSITPITGILLCMMVFFTFVSSVSGGEVVINRDCCSDAIALSGEGVFNFDNSSATLDGPSHAECSRVVCGRAGLCEDQIDLDVWAIWTSPCTATVFVKTCGLTDVDTRIAAYNGSACPTGDEGLLACNDDRCDLQSQVIFEAVTGQDYLIRVGTFPGELGGAGSVSITCGIDACPGVGDCLVANGSVGCDDESCCETMCNSDPFCCDSEWDETCAQEAAGLCSGSFDSCIVGAGDCTIARNPICRGGLRDTLPCMDDFDCPEGGCMSQPPGCGDVDCCNTICMDDPFCCIDTWDDFCVAAEPVSCYLSCGTGRGDCFAPRTINSDEAGCEDVSCCEQVCTRDPFCCGVEWDATCVENALEHCRGTQPICPAGEIVWIDPPEGVVDARFSIDPLTGIAVGIDTIIVQGPQGMQPPCWSLCESGSQGLPIESLEAVDGCGTYRIKLSQPLTAGVVTTVTYEDEFGIKTTAEFTTHPANVNVDGLSNIADVHSILEMLQDTPNPMFGRYSIDIDHSGELYPSDILAVIDLLNGADPFIPWMNTTKPTSENTCP